MSHFSISTAQPSRRPWPCSLNETQRNNRVDVLSRHMTSRRIHSQLNVSNAVVSFVPTSSLSVYRMKSSTCNERIYTLFVFICARFVSFYVVHLGAVSAFRRYHGFNWMARTTHTPSKIRSFSFRARFSAYYDANVCVCVCVACVTFSPDDLFVPLVTICICTCQLINASVAKEEIFTLFR